jgi:hypothetical protein
LEEHHHINTEIERISHLLNVKTEELKFLEVHSYDKLTFLRQNISVAIQSEQSGVWGPLAKVAKFMPNFLNAKVSEEILGPHITANITYHIDVKDAISISNYFSTKFFADVIEHIIPEKIQPMLEISPLETMRKVFLELVKRKNYYQLGSIVDYTPTDKVYKITHDIEPSLILVEVTKFANKKDRMCEVIKRYTDAKLKSIVVQAESAGLGDVVDEVLMGADPVFKKRMDDIIAMVRK